MSAFAFLLLLMLFSSGGSGHHHHHESPDAPSITLEQALGQLRTPITFVNFTAPLIEVYWFVMSFLLWGYLWLTHGSFGTITGMIMSLMLVSLGHGLIWGIMFLQMIALMYGTRNKTTSPVAQ